MIGSATLAPQHFTQTDPMPMGAGSSYEATYVYAGDNPNVYSDPSGLRKTKCNTSLGRQAGASFLGLASTFVPFYNRDFSQCEAQAVSKILAPATIVGSTLAAGSCGTLVGIGTLNPQMAAGAAGACGGVASGVAGGNLNLPDVSWGFAEGYSTAPPGNVPRPVSVSGAPASSASGARGLAGQLTREEASSIFENSGALKSVVIQNSRPIIQAQNLGNEALKRALISDGSRIVDWAKYSTQSFQSPSGPFQVHFYFNSATRSANYLYDYKVVFNAR